MDEFNLTKRNHMLQSFKEFCKQHTQKQDTESQGFQKEIFEAIRACRSQFIDQLTPTECKHPLITNMSVHIGCLYPATSLDRIENEKSLQETMQQIKTQLPHLSNAVDAFNEVFYKILPSMAKNSKHSSS